MRNPTAWAWTLLVIAAFWEVTWAILLKYTQGFTRPWPTAACITAMILSVLFLERAVRGLPIGTAYAVWTGLGAVGTALFGMLLFGESRSLLRLFSLALVVLGILGLKWTSRG